MKHWLRPLVGFALGLLAGAVAFGDWGGDARAPVSDSASQSAPEMTSTAPIAEQPVDSAADPGALTLKATDTPIAETPPITAPVSASEDPRLETALAGWRRLESEVTSLQARLASVERALAARPAQDETPSDSDRPTSPRTADERREALVASGVDPVLAEDIIWRDSRLELDRLNLRDLAIREGWMGTDRYRDELRAISGDERSMRDDIGDDAWDRYLFTTGEDNRVGVRSVIPGSAAEAAGLRPGDLIEAYAGERLFNFGEIREATTEGEAGELVPVQVRRGGAIVEAWVPRGPLGVQMESDRVAPLP
jgi:membrane-associated protease RseP (regulator of RpoE activity)